MNPELVIGEEQVEPGIVFIFEGAVRIKQMFILKRELIGIKKIYQKEHLQEALYLIFI